MQLRKIIREEINESSVRKPWYEALFNDIAAGRMGMFDPASEKLVDAWLAANPGTQLTLAAQRKRGKIPASAADAQWLRSEYTRWNVRRAALEKVHREMTGAVEEGTLDPYYLDSIIMWLQDRKGLVDLLQSSGIVERGEDLPSVAAVLSDAWRARRR